MKNVTPAGPVDQAEFRKLMSLFATGVCVVALGRDEGNGVDPISGTISGMTVNSFVSVSLEPTLVCWSLHNSSSQFDDYTRAGEFTISILAEGQQAIARRYAARGDTALLPTDFERSPSGLPVIAGALGHLECRHWSTYPAGDHTMIFGEVLAMAGASNVGAGKYGLGFFGGRFCSIGD